MLAVLVTVATLAVGYFNGANDVSKAIATLVGSGVSRYRAEPERWRLAGPESAARCSWQSLQFLWQSVRCQ